MQARSFSYHLLSPWERRTIFCVAAVLTMASVAWSSAMLDRVRFRPENTVYLFLTPPHRSFLEIFRSFPHPLDGYRDDTGLRFVRTPLVTSPIYYGWVDVECTLDEPGQPGQCRDTNHWGDGRMVDVALRYAGEALYRPARAGREKTLPSRLTIHVPFDVESESKLERRSGPALSYPSEMRTSRRPGWADIQCDIDLAGRADGCSVLHSSAPAFAQSALAYVAEGLYNTATAKTPNVLHLRHRFHIEFHPDD